MATTPTKARVEGTGSLMAASVPAWPAGSGSGSGHSGQGNFGSDDSPLGEEGQKPSQLNALQALLAFSALHEQVRHRRALAARHKAFDAGVLGTEFEAGEQFLLDEVLQLVAERGVAITGADGLAIALAENDEIVLRASAGMVRPDIGARIDRDSAFSGASFRTAQIVVCDDTEIDARVNLQACRRLGARSMVAVPLCGRRRVIGLLEAFSTWPFGFNDSDVRNLTLLAELVVSALKPEDEDRFAQSAQVAASKLEPVRPSVGSSSSVAPPLRVREVRVETGRIEQLHVEPIAPPAKVADAKPIDPTSAEKPSAPIAVGGSQTPSPVPVVSSPAAASSAAPAPAVAPAVSPASVAGPSTAAAPVMVAAVPAASVPAAPVAVPPVAAKTAESAAVAATPAQPEKAQVAAPATGVAKVENPVAQPAEAEPPTLHSAAISEPDYSFDSEAEREPGSWWLRPRGVVLLVGIVVVLAFAGGVFWKWRSSLGSGMVTEQTAAEKPAKPAANSASTDLSRPLADFPSNKGSRGFARCGTILQTEKYIAVFARDPLLNDHRGHQRSGTGPQV